MDKLTRNTIKFVNSVRAELDLPALKDLEMGNEGMIFSCPVANSINKDMPSGMLASAYSKVMISFKGDHIKTINTPADVLDWIKNFDIGKYGKYRNKR